MTDVIGHLYQKTKQTEYDLMWDARYEGIKTGGVVHMLETMDLGESKEAFRQLFGRLVRDIAALQKKPE